MENLYIHSEYIFWFFSMIFLSHNRIRGTFISFITSNASVNAFPNSFPQERAMSSCHWSEPAVIIGPRLLVGGASIPLHFRCPSTWPSSQSLCHIILQPNSLPTPGYTVPSGLRESSVGPAIPFWVWGNREKAAPFFPSGLRTCSPIQLLSKKDFIGGFMVLANH